MVKYALNDKWAQEPSSFYSQNGSNYVQGNRWSSRLDCIECPPNTCNSVGATQLQMESSRTIGRGIWTFKLRVIWLSRGCVRRVAYIRKATIHKTFSVHCVSSTCHCTCHILMRRANRWFMHVRVAAPGCQSINAWNPSQALYKLWKITLVDTQANQTRDSGELGG